MRDLWPKTCNGANFPWISLVALKLLFGSETVRGVQNSMNILYLHAKLGGDLAPHDGEKQKSSVFCLSVCLLFSHTCA